jgi:hypothetical protein
MTIKQQGGIFGRNPTFNNVTIDGTLSGLSNLSLSGNIVLADGQGIDFSATSGTGTSELLDDYEEGTWTPVVADASSGGNTSASVFSGDYTKVGNLVFVNCSLANIDTTGLTAGNDLYIQGLPFSPKSGAPFAGSVFGRVTITGKWCTAVISTVPAIRLDDNPGTNSNPTTVPVSGIADDAGDLRISITYIEG